MDAIEHVERGVLHYQQYRYDDALREFNCALELSSDCAPAYTGRGYVHHINGDLQASIADFNRAIELNPSDADAWKGRADSYQIAGKCDRAIADYDEAIRLYPGVADYFHRRGDAHSAVDNSDLAINDYRRAISLDPQNPVSHYFLADELFRKQAFSEAAHCYEEALRIDPELDAFVYGQYAWILATSPDVQCRNGEKAVEMAETAGEIDGWLEEEDFSILAAAYAAASDFQKAVDAQVKALEVAEDTRKELLRTRLNLYKSGCALVTSERP